MHAHPASNAEIATALSVSMEAVNSQMRTLFRKFGIEKLPASVKCARLAEMALASGIVGVSDYRDQLTPAPPRTQVAEQRGDSAQARQRGDVPASGAPSNATPSGAARGLAVQRLGRNSEHFPTVVAPCATRDLLPTIPPEDRACVTSLHGDCLPIWGFRRNAAKLHAALKRGHVILFHNEDVIYAAGEVACKWESDETSRAVGWKGPYPLIVSFTRTMTGREIKVREFKRDVSPFPDRQNVLELDANLYHRLSGAIWAGDSRKIAVFRRGVPCEPRDLPPAT